MIGTRADHATHAGHDLLLRLAGRMPDQMLWRLRDWLAAGDPTAIAIMLPRALLRHRVGLTDGELELLVTAVGGSVPQRLLDAVLPLTAPEEPPVRFGPGPAGPDPAVLALLAVVRGHPGCQQLRQAVRWDDRHQQRVVLVHGGERPWLLTATLQRLLRASGERTPCVEVLPGEWSGNRELPPYHQAALASSTLLWRPAQSPFADVTPWPYGR